MYLLSSVNWHGNGRTSLYPEQVGNDVDEIKAWVDYNYPDHGEWYYEQDLGLHRTKPVRNSHGGESLWSISTIDQIGR